MSSHVLSKYDFTDDNGHSIDLCKPYMDMLEELDTLRALVMLEPVPVKSSNIKSVAYNSKVKLLQVVFKGSGIYNYVAVPEHVAMELQESKSVGSYFHKHVKSNYACVKHIAE